MEKKRMKRKLITFVAYATVSIEVDDDATTIDDLTAEQVDEDEPLEEY